MKTDETSYGVAQSRSRVTLVPRDYLKNPDYGDEAIALRQAIKKRAKHIALIITSLCALCAFAANWLVASNASNAIGVAAWFPVIIVAALLAAGATLLAFVYSDYWAVKHRAAHELEFARALKAAFQLVAKSLDRLNDRCTTDLTDVREKRLHAVHAVYGRLLSEASQQGVSFLPEFLVRSAVIAAAEGMRAKPDVSDIWFAPDPSRGSNWWSPVGLPHLNHNLDDSKKREIEKDRDFYLKPDEGGASEYVKKHNEPIVVAPGHSLYCEQFRKLGLKTSVCIPLTQNDHVVGVMWHRYFAEVDIEEVEIDAFVEFGRTVITACTRLRDLSITRNNSLIEEAVSAVVGTYSEDSLADSAAA